MTQHVFGTFEAKNRLSHLLDLVEQGDEIIITRNGRPVARLTADVQDDATEGKRIKAREAFEWIKENRKNNSLGTDTIKDIVNTGMNR